MIKILMEFSDGIARATSRGDWPSALSTVQDWVDEELVPLPPGFANPHHIVEISLRPVGKD